MIERSAAIFVAACTPTFGLHSSSRITSSYSYFARGSALRSLTASSAELRPPMPLAATPLVSGPMNPTFTLSLATAVAADAAMIAAAMTATVHLIMSSSRLSDWSEQLGHCKIYDGISVILARPRRSGKQIGPPQPQGLHEEGGFHVIELP